ncbi:MAG: ABC transporter ATP-binding protein [Candidatus Nanopelagicales bacterium]|jgi:general nucleoside transport system ATP-binding protein|nr:ABC transporter ATP-binding protein [Candidatus Nanopelagicales bacterium]MDP4666731.1 ABC transporter ATP-binding protein [Candidatus Nanopelagicales bacterium]
MSENSVAVELKGIWKRFPGVIANSDINLKVAAGTVHAIVGENGAGKSTLMKILYGMQKADEGIISINGKALVFNSPSDAIAAGIGMVHQHFMLADNFTVLENIILGSEPKLGGKLDFVKARKLISDIAAENGLAVNPDVLVSELGVGDRQRIEILKVLYRGAHILILDEPTAVLVPHEVEELFNTLRDLKKQGFTVIFISHKLDEVLSIADEITVIRQGTTVGSVNPHTENVSARVLAEMMVGNELPTPQSVGNTIQEKVVLTVENLSVIAAGGKAIVDGVSFKIRAGEILGIAGVEGNGQAEILNALMGIESATGKIMFQDEDISKKSTRHRRDLGIGFIPEDRQRQALLLEAPLWENRMLGHQTKAPNAKGFWLNPRGAKADTKRIVAEYDVRTPSIDVNASALSGGNQQKLIVGREMSDDPKLLIAAHPTRGVDVGAQAAIWDHIRNARQAGLAVLLISADLDELIGLSDSIKVLLRGKFVADADPATVTPQELGTAMTGAGRAA